MTEEIEKAIKILTEKTGADAQPDRALKFSQAALNLAHTGQILYATERERNKTKGAST